MNSKKASCLHLLCSQCQCTHWNPQSAKRGEQTTQCGGRVLTRLQRSIRLPGPNDRQMPPFTAVAHLLGSSRRQCVSLLRICSFAFYIVEFYIVVWKELLFQARVPLNHNRCWKHHETGPKRERVGGFQEDYTSDRQAATAWQAWGERSG